MHCHKLTANEIRPPENERTGKHINRKVIRRQVIQCSDWNASSKQFRNQFVTRPMVDCLQP